MSEEMNDFASMFEASEEALPDVTVGDVVEATVIAVENSCCWVTIPGFKSDIPVSKRELARPEPMSAEDIVKVGDVIEVAIVSLGGENGGAVSKVKAEARVAWTQIEELKEKGEPLKAEISNIVKGGLVAYVNGLRGFIPASQMELHFVKDLSVYVGQTVEVLPIEIDANKGRLVLSRRQILEEDRDKKQEAVFGTIEAGQTIKGIVKRIVDYGAFIDVGGVDGLCHISDVSWNRVKNPSEVLSVGQEVDVYIKSVDKDAKRISLSVKDTMEDPWLTRVEEYNKGDIIEGKIIKLTDFGAFMQIEPGFDGLIPMGELSENRIEKADEAVKVGDMVRVKVLNIDKKKKRISLSIKGVNKETNSSEEEAE